jgi:hypothetical protein
MVFMEAVRKDAVSAYAHHNITPFLHQWASSDDTLTFQSAFATVPNTNKVQTCSFGKSTILRSI